MNDSDILSPFTSLNETAESVIDADALFHMAARIAGVLMLIIFLSSLTLSPAVLWALWKTKQLNCPVYRLVAFLLLDEILVRIFGSPLIMSSMLSGRWLYGSFGCLFYAFWMTWLGVAAASLFTCIAIERCIIVCHIEVKHRLTPRLASVVALLCYAHGLVWAVMPLVGVDKYVFEPSGLSCTPSWTEDNLSFILGLFSVCFIIPVVVSTFCYTSIFKTVRRHTGIVSSNRSLEEGVAKVMILTMVAFLVAWMPYSVIGILNTVGLSGHVTMPKEVTLIPLVTAKTAGMWHPVIFSFKNNDVKAFLAKQFAKLFNAVKCSKAANQIVPKSEIMSMSSVVYNKHKKSGSREQGNVAALFYVNKSTTPRQKFVPRGPTITDPSDVDSPTICVASTSRMTEFRTVRLHRVTHL